MFAPWLILLVAFSVCRGLQWADHLQDGEPVQLCSGDDIQLLWNYTLDHGERLEGMEWTCQPEGQEQKLLATYYGDAFVPSAESSGRLSHLKDGSIVVSCATILQSGNYSINVYTKDDLNTRIVHSRSATVIVIDTPKTTEGDLHITKHDDPVQDDKGEWHVQLSCGNFSDTGHPAIDVIWTTPDGQRLASSGFEAGMFHLLVPNPVVGGNYSCSVPVSDPTVGCLPKDSLLRVPVSTELEEIRSRFSLLEARQQEVLNKMAADNARLNGVMTKTEGLESKMAADSARLNGVMTKTNGLETRTDGLENMMGEYIANRRPVYFHVKLMEDTYFEPFDTMVMSSVVANTKDVYDTTTGFFTAPENGTYVLMATSGTTNHDGGGNIKMIKEGDVVARTAIPMYSDYRQMGTCHVVLEMQAGERVWLTNDYEGAFSSLTTFFSGFRI